MKINISENQTANELTEMMTPRVVSKAKSLVEDVRELGRCLVMMREDVLNEDEFNRWCSDILGLPINSAYTYMNIYLRSEISEDENNEVTLH